jgi:hypothetical protein
MEVVGARGVLTEWSVCLVVLHGLIMQACWRVTGQCMMRGGGDEARCQTVTLPSAVAFRPTCS